MNKYLHCIDLSDKLKCLNFCSTGVIHSLLPVQLVISDKRPNLRDVAIEVLRNCTEENINGLTSPRMIYVYQRSIFNNLKRTLTPDEERFIKIGDLEIAFEEARRKHNYGAPSRLSCLYLVEDNDDGRCVLKEMFGQVFGNPEILEVSILDNMELMRFDYRWIDLYFKDPQAEYLKNYWEQKTYNNMPSWEYLLEGSIRMTNKEQHKKIEEYVRINYPVDYNAIILEREKLKNFNSNNIY